MAGPTKAELEEENRQLREQLMSGGQEPVQEELARLRRQVESMSIGGRQDGAGAAAEGGAGVESLPDRDDLDWPGFRFKVKNSHLLSGSREWPVWN